MNFSRNRAIEENKLIY